MDDVFIMFTNKDHTARYHVLLELFGLARLLEDLVRKNFPRWLALFSGWNICYRLALFVGYNSDNIFVIST
jgi:hypothetical protein